MLAIQADENGRPVLIESVADGPAYFQEVTPERWCQIVAEEFGFSDAPRAVIPITVES
jgi:hypothetical protein